MESREKKIIYFEKEGEENTAKTLEYAIEIARERNIKKIVVASSTGKTAFILKDIVKDSGIEIVAVTYGAGAKFKEEVLEWDKNEPMIIKRGIKFVRGLHALSGVNRSITNKYKTATELDIIAETLRMISQGFKVCIEISVMAAESGIIDPNEDVIVIGGSGEGADTAIVMKPSYASNIFDIKIRQILCLPLK